MIILNKNSPKLVLIILHNLFRRKSLKKVCYFLLRCSSRFEHWTIFILAFIDDTSHIIDYRRLFLKDGFKISFTELPDRSPDLSILDFFFGVIKKLLITLKLNTEPKNLEILKLAILFWRCF